MPDISTPNLDYNNMVEAWDINDALMGGTLYMRQLGEAHMPRWPNEDKEDYKKRLAVATLLPAYEETINQNIGRVFAQPVVLSETTPEQVKALAPNIDLEGMRLDVWAQAFFGIAFQYGLAHALVDYPRVDAEQVRTKADEQASGARPYVTMLNPRQVIGWKSKTAGGKVVLTNLRIKEVVVVDGDDFGQTKVEQIRHILPGKVEIYRRKKSEGGEETWQIHEEWVTSRNDIPLVTLYTKRTGFMRGSPPLLNLALLNIKHWQSQSEQDNILHVARVPLLVVYGLQAGQELTIGSSSATQFENRELQGMEYVEHTGSAIGAGKTSLEDLENQMRQAGAKLLRPENTSTKSVEQTSEERMQEHSPLYTMANSLEDALDNILQIMAEWLGLNDGGNVDVRTELDVSEQSINAPAALAVQSLRQGGDIRRIDAVRALQSLKIIDPDAKPEEIIDELNNQDPTFTGNGNGNGQ
ncbi:MAG TPA: DNA-binding protein [Escherichia sp.]|nr:DNA-binding protein [Escherichia sp.]